MDSPFDGHGVDTTPPRLPRQAALFLDIDGTLAPIAPRPQDVRLPGWVIPVLQRLQQHLAGALAVVSGRSLAALDALLSPLRLPAAGVHGVQRRLSDGRVRVHRANVPLVVRRAADALANQHAGLLVEAKPGGLALHYRAQPDLGPCCADTLAQALNGLAEWELLAGHRVVEVKPRSVSKGAAVAAFMTEPAFAARMPFFVGDDASDEHGIAAAQAVGGVGVKVGPGESCARHRLPDPDAVGRWLRASADALDAG